MNNKKTALITGITGQDGSYLAEFLLGKGYEVHGLARWVALEDRMVNFKHISHLLKERKIIIHWGDVQNYSTLWKLVAKIQPDEIYHLAAISAIKSTFDDEFGAFNTNFNSVDYLLSAIKELKPSCRFYFAGSSEVFGRPEISPQDEETPLNPVSPYAIAKTAGFHLTKMYRETHGIFACTGIAYNHESPRRGLEFVTRKITLTAAKIKSGLEKELRLGNLDAKRDWGFAGDYVEAMWLMLQQEKPDDYVIGAGENYSIREFVETAFGFLDLDWKKYVVVDNEFVRPAENHIFLANPFKIKNNLGWKPKIKFKELVEMMVKYDLNILTKDLNK